MLIGQFQHHVLCQYRVLHVVRGYRKNPVLGIIKPRQSLILLLPDTNQTHQDNHDDNKQSGKNKKYDDFGGLCPVVFLLDFKLMLLLSQIIFHLIVANKSLLALIEDGVFESSAQLIILQRFSGIELSRSITCALVGIKQAFVELTFL